MMRKILTLILAICLTMPDADAQWYLFPGSPQKKKEMEKAQKEAVEAELRRIHGDKQPATGTENATTDDSISRQAGPEVAAQASSTESVAASEGSWDVPEEFLTEKRNDIFELDIPETIELALLLPIKSTSKPSENILEYYGGALMAARDLGNKGIRINVNAYDTEDASARITDNGLAAADVIIGPVSAAAIEKTLARCPADKFIVSPLEPRAAGLADSCRVVQVAPPDNYLIEEMVRWLKEDLGYGDSVIILKDEAESNPRHGTEYLIGCLDREGIRYETLTSYNTIRSLGSRKEHLRFIVSSERDIFICSAVNAIGKLGADSGNVTLYSTSKLRSMEGINAESLFNARTRMTAAYFVDYTSEDIRRFVLAYRAIFHSEPGPFAFHGYDSTRYFVGMCAEYGRQWYKKLPEKTGRGLQTDFRFNGTGDKCGYVNRAVRRVVYNQDLSMTLK